MGLMFVEKKRMLVLCAKSDWLRTYYRSHSEKKTVVLLIKTVVSFFFDFEGSLSNLPQNQRLRHTFPGLGLHVADAVYTIQVAGVFIFCVWTEGID